MSMSRIVYDLWNGNIAPCEHCGSHDPVANRLMCQIERSREIMCGELTEAQRAKFQKYMDDSEDYLLRMMELAFMDGFVLGSRLMMEVQGHNI